MKLQLFPVIWFMTYIHILYIVIASIVAFILGSIPFSVWLGVLVTRKDLRDYNNQNPGGFNAAKTYGFKIGISIIFLDQFKGIITLGLIDHLFALPFFNDNNNTNVYHTIMCILGPALCILGHNYSPWLRFRGGQGMGVYMGLLFYINPLLLAIFFLIYTLFYIGFKIPTRLTGTIVVLFTCSFISTNWTTLEQYSS